MVMVVVVVMVRDGVGGLWSSCGCRLFPTCFALSISALSHLWWGGGIIRCVNVSGRRDANHDQVKRADRRTLEVQDKLIKCQRKLSEGVMSCKSLHSLTRLNINTQRHLWTYGYRPRERGFSVTSSIS